MKYTLSILILIACSLSMNAQESQCLQKMRIGKFNYVDKHVGTTIVRKGNKHIEYSNEGKSKLILKVKWLNDYTYILTFKRAVNKTDGYLKKGAQIEVKIISCDGNKYLARYTSNDCDTESWFIKLN